MSRRRANLAAACVVAVWCAASPRTNAQSPADVLDEYLVEHGLARLRARMLEQEVTRAVGEDRVDLAERLAELYSEELERADSTEDQREWERLARNLLTKVPELQSVSMRLGLAKARFTSVERTAEQWRLRMVSEGDRVQTQSLLEGLAREFRELAGRAHLDVRTLEGQEESVLGGDTDLIAESLTRSRQQRSIAHYLAAWCYLYLAEMAPNADQGASLAGDAAEEFSWLLNTTPSRVPAIDRVPEQLLKYEHMARAAIAVAACESLRNDTTAALNWLDLVESAPELPTGVSSPLFARRMWVLARAGRWSEVRSLVAKRRAAAADYGAISTPLSVVEARLLAVLAIESKSDAPDRAVMLPIAISDLIARGEHAHLLDLTRRYSSSELNLTGFLAHHVRGVRLYDQARAAQKAERENGQLPTRIASIAKNYTDAATAFDAAAKSPDAKTFAGSEAGNLMLLGMSYYFAGDRAGAEGVQRAVAALLRASELATETDMSAESMWMAIRVLEAHHERTPSESASKNHSEELMAQFMTRFPSSPRAGEIALRQALQDPQPDEQSLQMLLAVPEGTPQHEAARRHAEQMAYELFRAAPQSQSSWLASRFITIAEPLLAIDQRLAFQGDEPAADAVILRCRRMVDALLAMSPPDHDRAERVLDVLISLRAGAEGTDDIDGEIAYRRAQIALARGDEQAAFKVVESIRAKDPALADSAARLVLRHVATRWSQAEAGSEQRLTLARRLLDLASPDLNAVRTTHSLRADPREAALRVMAAEAAIDVWRAHSDQAMLRLADRLAVQLREAFPNDARVLTVTAETAEARGDFDSALDDWRTLVVATPAGTDLWFQRRLRQLNALSRVDPDRAREALNQHRTLYPGLAPEPFLSGFIELQQRLGTRDAPNQSGGTSG